MSAQEQTIRQYHELMKLNAVSHVVRAARELGIFAALSEGQRTADQLCGSLGLREEPAKLFLEALVASGVIEQYGDDYALSHAMRLLCQYDADLGDARWQRLTAELQREKQTEPADEQMHIDAIAATQWIHTASAMQAAEILDIGGEGWPAGARILDLGCGSAVWSCAMAYRDEQSLVTAVDTPARLQAGKSTAASIELTDRFEAIEAEPNEVELPQHFDLTLIAQRLHVMPEEEGERLLRRAVAATVPGGRVAVIDLFQSPTKPALSEALAALKMQLETRAGRIPTLQETQKRLIEAGLSKVQFTFLAASGEGLGIAVGEKPQN